MLRRTFLAGTVTSATLLSGCLSDADDSESDSSEDDTAESSDDSSEGDTTESSDDVFNSVDIGGSELTFTLTEDAEVDTVRFVNPDGSQHSQTSINTGVSSDSFEFADEFDEQPYEPDSDYSLIALSDESVVSERTVAIAPELEATVTTESDQRPEIEVTNTGTGPAFVGYVRALGGIQETTVHQTPSSFGADPDSIIPPGESETYAARDWAFVYPDREDEMCTGSGQDDIDLEIRVYEGASNTELVGSETVNVQLLGDATGAADTAGGPNSQRCTDVEIENLTVTLEEEN